MAWLQPGSAPVQHGGAGLTRDKNFSERQTLCQGVRCALCSQASASGKVVTSGTWLAQRALDCRLITALARTVLPNTRQTMSAFTVAE